MTELQHDRNIIGDKPEVEPTEQKIIPNIECADDLKGNARLSDESREEYKARRKRENKWLKNRLRNGVRRIR